MNRLSFLLILLIFPLGLLWAQPMSPKLYNQLPDSLKPKDRLAVSHKELVAIVKGSASLDMLLGESELDTLCGKAIHTYTVIKNKREQWYFLATLTTFFYNRGFERYQDSIIKYNNILLQLVNDAGAEGNRLAAAANATSGAALMNQSKYAEAYKCLQEALIIAQKMEDKGQESYAYSLLASFYYGLALDEKVILYIDSAIRSIDTASEEYRFNKPFFPLEKAISYLRLFENTHKAAFADSAENMLNQVKVVSIYKRWKPHYFILRSQLAYDIGDYSGSITYADSAGLFMGNEEESILNGKRKAFKGLSLLHIGYTEKGIKLLQEINIDLQAQSPPTDIVLSELTKYYKEKGNYAKALVLQEKLLQFNKASLLEKYQGEAFEMEQKYNVAARDAEILKLKKKETRNIWVIVFASVIICFVLMILFIRNRNNKRQRKLLVAQIEEQVKMQVYRIEQAKEDQRKQFGQSLHDDFAGTLAGTLQFLNAQMQKETHSTERTKYLKITNELEKSYAKARHQSHEAYYEETSDNFWEELTDSIKLFFISSGIKLNLMIDEVNHPISVDIKIALFFILKEAVTNIIKHAKADTADILLYEELNHIFLEIKDNGNGFLPKTDKGIGLQSLKERAGKLGGKCSISSERGKGTILAISIPLNG